MPLTLRANVGDCIKVKLTNRMKEGRASFSAISLAFDPKDSLGANVGNKPGDQTVEPGESRTYTYYADPSLGEIASLVWDWGDVMTNPRNGLFGAIIIGPKGAAYRDPKTGADISNKNSWIADVIVDRTIPGYEHRANYRDAALFFQDGDNIIGTSFMPYVQNAAGLTAVNYRSEPYKFREEIGCTLGRVFQPCAVERAHYDWMGYVAMFIAVLFLIPLRFAGYWLMREVYAYRQQMGITLMGGLLAWLFIIQAVRPAGRFSCG
jgi:hypothetical protein